MQWEAACHDHRGISLSPLTLLNSPQVERIWDMVNGACGDSQAALIAGVTSLTKRRKFNRQEMKLSVILQFVAHGGELKKLKRIGKEFAEFVVYSKRKRLAIFWGSLLIMKLNTSAWYGVIPTKNF